MNSKVLRTLSYGVYIVSTMDGERPTGCTANSANADYFITGNNCCQHQSRQLYEPLY